MWLAGGAKPDHNTISDFRSKRLNGHLKQVFNQVVVRLAEQGVLSLEEKGIFAPKKETALSDSLFL